MSDIKEEIISRLQEIDSTFSMINRNLREINEKLEKIHIKNTKIINYCKPWISFFSTKNPQPFNAKPILNTPQSTSLPLNVTSPPQKPIYTSLASSESIEINFPKNISYEEESFIKTCDSDDSSLHPFNLEELPDIFKQEIVIQDIYFYIQSVKSIDYSELKNIFSQISTEKFNIFLNLLTRKKFILQRNNIFSVEKLP
ncbi:hypothetical protein CWI37_1149p0030 [Hamiltosporidium tvaerminnensis]|uniref:DASH complex subunit ASK1 n=1 Tax=Hamiltosporidium tvaerminnensis TaxID=1176355 RepID=A0A4Q9L0E6_9MICR|nr:hypothetical protein LUQ84_002188 [Hamiltosporidium tvaerminnensis]TBT99989.1 hypothetical protein CWI37_1149p0030 [Hamiltosporidium tvaerminnensis]